MVEACYTAELFAAWLRLVPPELLGNAWLFYLVTGRPFGTDVEAALAPLLLFVFC